MNDHANANASPFVIEQAKPGDEATIVAMIRELAEYEKLEDQCVITAAHLREALFGERPACEALLIKMNDEPAAYVIYYTTFSTFLGLPGLYLEDLFVRPKYRRNGIGGAVLRHLAKLADERGCGRLEWAVLEWNELAKAQYRKIGAEPLEDWRTWRLAGKDLRYLATMS